MMLMMIVGLLNMIPSDDEKHINVRFHPWEEPDTGDHDQAGFRAEPGLSWKQQQQQQQQPQQQKRTWIKLSWIA